MRLYPFEAKKRQQLIGAEVAGQLIDLNAAHAARLGRRAAMLATSMLELIRGGDAALKRAKQALTFAKKNPKQAKALTYNLAEVKVLAPIPRPGKIFCSGLNYRSHVEENPAATFLADPRFFVKVSSAIIGPGEAIRKFLRNYGNGDKDVDIIGFSRGSALAREFANMLYERGYSPTKVVPGHGRNVTIRNKECDVVIRYVGVFDTVASFGKPGNSINIGYNLNLPRNVKTARHAVAKNEKRALFPLTRFNQPGPGQSFQERVFPGDHSDIGGGHNADQNMLADAPLRYIWSEGKRVGVPFGDLPQRNLINSYTPHDLSTGWQEIAGETLLFSPLDRLLGRFSRPRRNLPPQ